MALTATLDITPLVCFTDELIADINANQVVVLTEMVAAVRSIHTLRPWHWMKDGTTHGQKVFPDRCDHCHANWPCATIAAITP